MNQASGHVRAKEPWRRYLPWQGGIELAFWVFAFAIPAIANTMVALMDAQRDGHTLPAWQPALWEGSSALRSEEHTSELQSLMRNSYAVFCLKKKNKATKRSNTRHK